MKFKTHLQVEGRHATLSASNHSWIRYDLDKLRVHFDALQAAKRGTELHEFAANAIRLGMKLEDNGATVNRYVNDCIGFRMTPEQTLFYSDNVFGTADAISFRQDPVTSVWVLRIFDLKTGLNEVSIEQLEAYAAFFFLEYNYKVSEIWDIQIELRIYQNDDVRIFEGDHEKIAHIMAQAVFLDKHLAQWRMESM